MGEREALLRAVLEWPDDDLPRLVYAERLFRSHPITRVEFTDREPELSGYYSDWFRWYTDTIPVSIYTLLQSGAAVAYGRELAGLSRWESAVTV